MGIRGNLSFHDTQYIGGADFLCLMAFHALPHSYPQISRGHFLFCKLRCPLLEIAINGLISLIDLTMRYSLMAINAVHSIEVMLIMGNNEIVSRGDRAIRGMALETSVIAD